MKFLILTCNTGGGHNSAATAIADYFTAQGHRCETMDCLDFLSPAKAKLISEGHVFLYRWAPRLFGMGYRYEENHTPRLILSQCEDCADEFYAAVVKLGCDAVIHVHPFAALIMSAAKRDYGLELPGYFVATDYTCSPSVSCSDMDAYFIPHPALTEEFIRCGISAKKLVPTGIPVRAAFYDQLSQAEARRRLELPETGHMILMACGSMGAGPMEELTHLLNQQMSSSDHLVIVCGTNKKLQEKLKKAQLPGSVRILGYTDQMDLYMDAADLMLTKGGGLTTTEVLQKHLPLVFVNVIPGLEVRNIDFMVSHGYATTAPTPKALADLCCRLLQYPERLAAWRHRLAQDFSVCAAEQMYRHIQKTLRL